MEKKSLNHKRLMELIEREKHYIATSGGLYSSARDARQIHSGISGANLIEKNSWANKAMVLKLYSEDRVKRIRSEMKVVELEGQVIAQEEKTVNIKLDSVKADIRKNRKFFLHSSELIEIDDLQELDMIRKAS
jgi:hypothetical protein